MKTWQRIVLSLVSLLILAVAVSGQDVQDEEIPDTSVYVTTQDYSSLRKGPGSGFERIAVVDPVITLPAIGRTSDTRWVQVVYDGQTGWIAAWLLVWSGDIIVLPVDGVSPQPFVRIAGVLGVTTRETPLYRRYISPDDQVGILEEGTQVEVTGRLGLSGFYNLQIRHAGHLYWVGSWNIRIISGRPSRVLDTAYLYPYGRLVKQLNSDIDSSATSLRQIEDIWRQLDGGRAVSCGFIPAYVLRNAPDTDVQKERIFNPAVIALDNAVANVNAAISAFEDACRSTNEDFSLAQQDVNRALANIDEARRNINLASSLLASLGLRDPLLNRD